MGTHTQYVFTRLSPCVAAASQSVRPHEPACYGMQKGPQLNTRNDTRATPRCTPHTTCTGAGTGTALCSHFIRGRPSPHHIASCEARHALACCPPWHAQQPLVAARGVTRSEGVAGTRRRKYPKGHNCKCSKAVWSPMCGAAGGAAPSGLQTVQQAEWTRLRRPR